MVAVVLASDEGDARVGRQIGQRNGVERYGESPIVSSSYDRRSVRECLSALCVRVRHMAKEHADL